MDKAMEKRFILFLSGAIVISIVLAGFSSIMDPEVTSSHHENVKEESGGTVSLSDPGFDIGYLDDTREGERYVWRTLISEDHDIGVLWINNTSSDNETYLIMVEDKPEGWSVSMDITSVTVAPYDDMGTVVLFYHVPDNSIGSYNVTIAVENQNDPNARREMTIICDVKSTDADTTARGDTIMIDYSLTDPEGNVLDAGGLLPVTAGEIYVGAGGQLGYIDGFYLAVLGMRLPSTLAGISGEDKIARIPPELAYGETPPDEGGHALGGVTLIFTISVVSDIPG